MPEHDFVLQLPEYAANSLSGSEKTTLEGHLNHGCEICEAELMVFRETFNRLPYGLPQRELRPEVKAKVMERIQAEFPAPSVRWGAMIRFAAVVALLALGAYLYFRHTDAMYQKEKTIAGLQKQVREQKQEIQWLRDPSVQLALLTGLAENPEATGKIVWNADQSRGMFYARSLRALSPEKDYQLWVIGDQGPVSAGVFKADPEGSAVVTISRIASPVRGELQFAVTIEPRGGLKQPSGSMILAGKAL